MLCNKEGTYRWLDSIIVSYILIIWHRIRNDLCRINKCFHRDCGCEIDTLKNILLSKHLVLEKTAGVYLLLFSLWISKLHRVAKASILYNNPGVVDQCLYSLSGRTSYHKISWSLEAARLGFRRFQSFWNLTGTSTALLPRCLSNLREIRSLYHPISRLRDFTRFGGKTSCRLVNRGPVSGTFHLIFY